MAESGGAETQTSNGANTRSFDASRAATLAKLEAGEASTKADDKHESKPSPAAVAGTPESAATTPQRGANEAGDGGDTTTGDDAPDAETDKRLAAIQRNEKLARERLGKETSAAKLELEQAAAKIEREWGPRVQKAVDYEAAVEKRDLPAVLKLMGYDEDGFEEAAKVIYGLSKTGAADPKNREASERMLRERRDREEVASTKKRLADLESKIETEGKQAAMQREANEYLDGAVKAIGDTTPLTKALAAKNPAKVRGQLHQLTVELAQETGELPTHAAVVAAFEKRRIADLEELGGDVSAYAAKPAAKVDDKKIDANAAKKKTETKPAGEDDPLMKLPPKERRAKLLARIEAGEID